MTQEDKDLLLKELCSRLPYNPMVEYKGEFCDVLGITHGRLVLCKRFMSYTLNEHPLVEEVKPYLFPISSMTEEELNDFYEVIRPAIEAALDERKADKTEYEGERPITLSDIKTDIVAVDWMLKNHFDMNGLIEKGLAIDATGLNIY